MVVEPMSAAVMEAYRNTLQVNSAPSVIDSATPVVPVAIVAQASVASIAQFFRLTDGTDSADILGTSVRVIDSWERPSGSTSVNAFTTSVSTTYATLYTVTAGKTAYITDITCGSFGGSSLIEIGASGTTRFLFVVGAAGTGIAHNFRTPLVFTAGETIQVRGGAGISGGAAAIRGFEI